MKVLVVDDEPLARRRLIRMLDKLGVAVVGEAGDGVQALAQIRLHRPECVFLDIRMPGLDGMEVARRLGDCNVVFTTAYSEHAVEAFDGLAVDYLLKPIKKERLERAVERVRAKVGGDLATLLESLLPSIPRVSARHRDATHVFDAREISRFYAENKYTVFESAGRTWLTEESLSTLEDRLTAHGFLRVHRSELICVDRVKSIRPEGDGLIAELDDGQRARVSRRSVTTLKERLGL